MGPPIHETGRAESLSSPLRGRWNTVAPRRLIGAILGLLGFLAGVIAFAIEQPVLGVVAAVFALAAGLLSHSAEARAAISEARVGEIRAELDGAREDVDRLREDLALSRDTQATTRDELAQTIAASAVTPFTPPTIETHSPTDVRLLSDPETNLFSEAYFRVALDARIASARRHLRPVAVALVEVVEGIQSGDSREADPVKVTGSIRQTLRDADTACRMSNGCFALILEDTPENGAVWTVERIRRNLTSRHGQHTLWAGVACYPAHAFSTDEILDQATVALASAREWKQDRIEIATAE